MFRVVLSILAVLILGIVGPIVAGAMRHYEPLPAAPLAQVDAAATGLMARSDHRFRCGDAWCAGTLYLPRGGAIPPAVIMGGGFAGTQDVALPEFAAHLAEAGIAVFTFDYRFFGASGGAPRQLVDPKAQLADWHAAIAYVSREASVDGRRLALLGASLGGGHALIAASQSKNVTAVVAMVPLVDTRVEAQAGYFGAAWLARLLAFAWGDLWLAGLVGDTLMIPVMVPHGQFGMIVDDAAFAALKHLAGSSPTYKNEVAARSIFTFDDFNPAIQAAGLDKPALLIASKTDRFAPFSASAAFASKQRNRQLIEISCDHFEVYTPPCSDKALGAVLAFLRTHWPLEPVAPQ